MSAFISGIHLIANAKRSKRVRAPVAKFTPAISSTRKTNKQKGRLRRPSKQKKPSTPLYDPNPANRNPISEPPTPGKTPLPHSVPLESTIENGYLCKKCNLENCEHLSCPCSNLPNQPTNTLQDWIVCDSDIGCHQWFHRECVNVTKARFRSLQTPSRKYVCPSCDFLQNTEALAVREFLRKEICTRTTVATKSQCCHIPPIPASTKTNALENTPPNRAIRSCLGASPVNHPSPTNLWTNQSPEDPPTVTRPIPKFYPAEIPSYPEATETDPLLTSPPKVLRVSPSDATVTRLDGLSPRSEHTPIRSPPTSISTPVVNDHSFPSSPGGISRSQKDRVVLIDNIDHPVLYKSSRDIKAEVNRVRPDLNLELAYPLAGGGICLLLKSEEDTASALEVDSWPELSFNSRIITVHRPKRSGPKKVFRCYKCQRLGHIAKTCSFEPRCVRCSKSHETKD